MTTLKLLLAECKSPLPRKEIFRSISLSLNLFFSLSACFQSESERTKNDWRD